MANKKISQLNAVTTLSNNDVFPVVQGTETKKAKISDIKSYLPTASSLLTGLLSNTDWVTFNNKQNALTLGNLTESTSSVLTITGGTGSIIGSGLTIQVKQASGSQSGFLSSTDWSTFNGKMSSLTLTTTGTSGAATLVGSTLNIPQYLGSAITSLGGQTGATQTFSTDTTGSDFTIASVSNNHKFSIPNASGSARGLLTSSDWTAFNNKEAAVSWGSLTETTSSILTITGGSSAVRGNVTVAVKQVGPTQDGYLGKGDYTTFVAKQNAITLTTTGSSGAATLINDVLNIPQYSGGGGISTLNALTASTQTFATGTTGTDFNISSATSTHTFNIPDAGASARGVVTTGTQTLAGDKTFSSAPTFSTMTAGSLLFAGTSGLLSQDNTNLFWDNTNKRLGIGTNAPGQTLRVVGDTSFARTITLASGTGGVSSFQTILSPTVNSTGSHRGLFIATNHSAAGINFTGFNTASAWIENRPFNAGTIQQLNGFITSGLVLASNTISCGTVSEVIAGRFLAVNQFSNTLTTTITTAISLLVDNNIKTNATITNAVGAVFNGMTTGTNNTDLLIGTSTPPSGNWSIYGASANNNYINSKLFIGTTTDAGYKLDVNGTTRSVTSIESPIVRGNTTASGSLTLSSTSNATKGNIIFGSSTYFYDEVNNCLKLGNVLPPTDSSALRLQVSNESSNATIACTAFTNTAAESGGINFARYRGTAASPSAVQSGDRLGLVASLGYDGSARQASSAILFSCDGAVSSGVMPGAVEFQTGTSGAGRTTRLTISSAGNFTYFDGGNFILGTTTGSKIGTSTSQKIGFWNATPIVQPTTAVAGATRVGGAGTTVTDTDTFDGYTIAQVVKALRNSGLLA